MTNEQIAREVMEWTTRKEWHGVNYFNSSGIQEFNHDFLNCHNAAMMVVEKMYSDGYFCCMDNDHVNNKYDVMFFGKGKDHDAQHESLCHAICEAALMAKGIDIESKG